MRHTFIPALAVFSVALAALIVVFYTFPNDYDSWIFGLDPKGMHHFQAHLGLGHLPVWNYRIFSRAFHALLILLWGGYAFLLLAYSRSTGQELRPLAIGVACIAAAVALLAPPLLSSDLYAYASQGRIFIVAGQNPYLQGPEVLIRARDPVAPYLIWDIPTVYGPLWTWIEIGIAALLRTSSLWSQIVAFKLLGAGALVASALAGRRLADHFAPGWGNLTFLAIGLNPLLQLEDVGNGHNDIFLLCFLLIGAALYFEKKYIAAALCLGLAVAIKPIPLALLPWILLDYSRNRTWRQVALASVSACALVVLPLILLFAPLWAGPATLTTMQQRTSFDQDPASLASTLRLHLWLAAHGIGPRLSSVVVILSQNRLIVALYAGLSLWLWKTRTQGAWLTAWTLFAGGLMFFFLKPTFPWYFTWCWPLCLLRWNRLHLILSTLCLGLSLYWMWSYGMITSIGKQTEQIWITSDPTAPGGFIRETTGQILAGSKWPCAAIRGAAINCATPSSPPPHSRGLRPHRIIGLRNSR